MGNRHKGAQLIGVSNFVGSSLTLLYLLYLFLLLSPDYHHFSVDKLSMQGQTADHLLAIANKHAERLLEAYKHDISEVLHWSLRSNKPDFVKLFIGQASL